MILPYFHWVRGVIILRRWQYSYAKLLIHWCTLHCLGDHSSYFSLDRDRWVLEGCQPHPDEALGTKYGQSEVKFTANSP